MLALLSSCSGKGGKSVPKGLDSKLSYSPEKNLVSVIPLERKVFNRQLVSNGKLSAVSRASLSFRVDGVISKINYKNGDIVPSGAVIARIDDSSERLSLESARIALDKARLDLQDVLVGQGYAVSDSASVPAGVMSMAKTRSGYSEACNRFESASADLAKTVLRAPFRGRVADIKTKPYDKAPSDVFCTLIDDSEFDVDFKALESECVFVEAGLPVKVSAFGASGSCADGRIVSVNPTVDENGQVAVKAGIAGGGDFLDGMNVRVIVSKSVNALLVVPKSAVVIRDNMDVLFRYSQGRSEWVYVNLLMSNAEEYAVEANSDRGAVLEAGDSVIVSGNLNLADGSEVVLKK